MQAASSSSTQATNERVSRRARAPSMVSGKSTAVSTTRNSEIPSMPSDQWMPSPLAQVWSLTIWYVPTPALKTKSTAAATASVITVTTRPRASWNQVATARLGTAATTAAPTAGTRTRVVR